MEPDYLPEPELDARLAALRVASSRLDTPRCVEKELMQAFAAQFPPRRPWYRRMNVLEWGAAGVCAAVAVAVLASLLAPPAPYAGFASHAPLVRFENGGAFIALDSFERIAQEPEPQLVETELPRTMLATLGLPVAPEQAGEPVRADMLVAADGELLALRLSAID